MESRTGGAGAPGLGNPQAPQTPRNDRPERDPMPLGGKIGSTLAVVGLALILLGCIAGPVFVHTDSAVLPAWDAAMQAIGHAMTAGVPLGIVLLATGVAGYLAASWLRTRYPGCGDIKNNIVVRLYDQYGHILHPDDLEVRVRRRHGIYRVLIRLQATGLQYGAKRDAVIKAIIGMGFAPPEVTPYRGPGAYDLDAVITSRLVTDGYLERWEAALDDLRARVGRGRRR